MLVPTPRLSVALLVAVLPASVVVGATGADAWLLWAFIFGGAVLVAGLIDVFSIPAPGRIQLERSLPSSMVLGTEAEVAWTCRNPTSRDVRLAFADEFPPSLRAPRRATLMIPARGSARACALLRPERRGRFEPTELVVRVGGRLGLVVHQQKRAVPSVLRVLPPYRSRRLIEARLNSSPLVDLGLHVSRRRGTGTEFDQLREYVSGDDFRRIDWGATGRLGHPIVRTYTAEQHQAVHLLVDNGRVMAGRVGDIPRSEYAIDAALAMASAVARSRDRLGLIAFDRTIRARVPLAAGPQQQARVAEALFDLEAELTESSYLPAVVDVLQRHRRRSLIVLMTELVEPVVVDSIVPAVAAAGARHQIIVAAVRDPKLALWADAAGSLETRTLYRAAAAADAIASRARAADRLRSAGAVVVDAEPEEIAWALVEAYLKMKATGRL